MTEQTEQGQLGTCKFAHAFQPKSWVHAKIQTCKRWQPVPAPAPSPGGCACPHGCGLKCDEQGRCPVCWNGGKGCPILFGAPEPSPEHDPRCSCKHGGDEIRDCPVHGLVPAPATAPPRFRGRNGVDWDAELEYVKQLDAKAEPPAPATPAAERETDEQRAERFAVKTAWSKESLRANFLEAQRLAREDEREQILAAILEVAVKNPLFTHQDVIEAIRSRQPGGAK